MESAALPGFPHLGFLGKRIKLALANSLMHYLPSTLRAKCGKRKSHAMDRPHRLHPVGTTRSPQGCQRHPGVTDRPYTLIPQVECISYPLWLGRTGRRRAITHSSETEKKVELSLFLILAGCSRTTRSLFQGFHSAPFWTSCSLESTVR